METYDYVEPVNSNLMCCICRMPFSDPTSTRTCAHTFCYECITTALDHAAQCPVDRSPLALVDLLPANPIIRSLVDELSVECIHRSAGCMHVCQRQILATHLKEDCEYAPVACPDNQCDQVVLRKDVGTHRCVHRLVECDDCGAHFASTESKDHRSTCPSRNVVCEFCSAEIASAELAAHNEACPDFVIPCPQAINGCPWTGPRHALPLSHSPSCPYESIKGFFSINNARLSRLTEENLILRHKVDSLEGAVQNAKREMQAVKIALGPWYRPDGLYLTHRTSSELSLDAQPASASTSQGYLYGGDVPSSPQYMNSEGIPLSPPHADPQLLASYFPPEYDTSIAQALGRPASDQPLNNSSRPPHRPSTSVTPDTNSVLNTYPRPPSQTSVAPINLSTTLEGSLGSLRESVVSLSVSVDSLARRSDIALTNETLRLNEEVMSLRANIHGLRMQVHAIMMDRNAQVTGRPAGSASGDNGWPGLPGRFYGAPLAQASPSITKL